MAGTRILALPVARAHAPDSGPCVVAPGTGIGVAEGARVPQAESTHAWGSLTQWFICEMRPGFFVLASEARTYRTGSATERLSMRAMLLGLLLGVTAGAVLPATPGRADLLGQGLTASYRYPDLATSYAQSSWSPASFTVGAGPETVGDIEGVTTISADFSAATLSLVLNTVLPSPTWTGTSFNGPVFTAAAPLGITGATVIAGGTTMAGFDDSRVTVTANEIQVNWGGLSYVDGTAVAIRFTFAAVPEPAALALLATGLLGLGLAGRRGRSTGTEGGDPA